MITFGKAYAIGNGAELKTDKSIIENGKEIGRIYFAPLSFNNGFPYNVVINRDNKGFFASIQDAENFCLTGKPSPMKFWK